MIRQKVARHQIFENKGATMMNSAHYPEEGEAEDYMEAIRKVVNVFPLLG